MRPRSITVDRWVPRLHPFKSLVPRLLDGARRDRKGWFADWLGSASLRVTVAVSVELVTFCETRRFPCGHLPSPRQHQEFAQVRSTAIGACPCRYSFVTVTYFTVSAAGERRQNIDRIAGV